GVNPTTCSSKDGSVTLSAITSPNLYSYFISGPAFSSTGIDKNAATQGPFGGLGAGTYSAIITDQVSGCTVSNAVGISSNAYTVTPTIVSACDPPTVKITTTASPSWSYQ